MSISPSLSPRQCLDRYAFRAAWNLSDKKFRHLRTVIVTAAVHRGFGRQLPCHQDYFFFFVYVFCSLFLLFVAVVCSEEWPMSLLLLKRQGALSIRKGVQRVLPDDRRQARETTWMSTMVTTEETAMLMRETARVEAAPRAVAATRVVEGGGGGDDGVGAGSFDGSQDEIDGISDFTAKAAATSAASAAAAAASTASPPSLSSLSLPLSLSP
ncbi:uncharacterized protein LOC130961446 [Arachis stenosperma]|uniref:uncharacterized protein LOC130961446 n=1 Tax=Arachis stenosperma TaxID=217475 RepID=UPI0025AC6114|nr:uncharacterized protein LOC130961446 [Arachis stenosperma]